MPSKTNNLFFRNSPNGVVKHLSVFLVLFLVISPLLVAAFYTSFQAFRDLHNFTLSHKQTTTFLAATTLKEKLGRVIDVGVSLSTRVQFRKLIESGKWDEAIKIMESVPKDFSYIDRVSIYDSHGILWAATPTTSEILAVVGQNFSYRDYYQGISKNWQPYVSEAFKPAVPLGYNLVAIAIPIKSEPNQKIVGVLLLSIKLDTVLEWSKKIDIGPAGFVYIVDQKGNLVAHPTLLSEKDVVNFSSVPAVQKVLKGERGVEVLFNPIENEDLVTAYEPLPEYGWGVVSVQPTRTAFSERNKAVGRIATIWILVIFAVGFFTYRLLRNRITIKAQRDRERIFLESVGDGVLAIGLDWHITLWNKAASRITGWTQEEVLGKPFREIVKLIQEKDRKENIVFIEEAILYAEPRVMKDHTILITKEGKEIPVGDSAAPIIDSKGNITGAIIVFRDTSKEKEAGLLRSNFAYASHQLRTPVNKAIWSLELALEKNDLQQVKEAVQNAHNSVKSIYKLSEQIIDVSEIDQGTVMPERKSFKLNDLIIEAIKAMTEKAKLTKIIISSETTPPELTVDSDYKLLKKALIEVLENAIDYNVFHGRIKIEAIKKEKGVLINVEDSGIGIPEVEQTFIFTKFFRGSNFDTNDIVGAGLGLYTAREYIKLLNGKIWFTSKEKLGTIFSIFLSS